MNPLTLNFIAVVTLVVVAFDLWLAAKKGQTATISAVLLKLARVWPVVALAIGLVCGHLFWPQEIPPPKCPVCPDCIDPLAKAGRLAICTKPGDLWDCEACTTSAVCEHLKPAPAPAPPPPAKAAALKPVLKPAKKAKK